MKFMADEVTDQDGFLPSSTMIKEKNTLMKERIWISIVWPAKLSSSLCIPDTGALLLSRGVQFPSRIPPAYCHCWNAVILDC